MKTYSTKPAEIEKKWVQIDATNMVVGRLAAAVAARLRGKHLPHYTPHIDCGDNVVITNAEKIAMTGKKISNKIYYRHTGYPGGIKETTPEKILEGKHPERVVEMAIKRMLPSGPLGRQLMRNLKVYAGAEHPHEAQSPEVIDLASANSKNVRK